MSPYTQWGECSLSFVTRKGAQTALELLHYLSVEITPFTLAFSQYQS